MRMALTFHNFAGSNCRIMCEVKVHLPLLLLVGPQLGLLHGVLPLHLPQPACGLPEPAAQSLQILRGFLRRHLEVLVPKPALHPPPSFHCIGPKLCNVDLLRGRSV